MMSLFQYKYIDFTLMEGYEQLWKAIIRPPRAQYDDQDLGPKLFKKHGVKIKRTDLKLTNQRGLDIVCSHYEPAIRPAQQLPCVIYLHGNSSCRLQGARIVHYLISRNITVFTFDFAGCGNSDGVYISLGYYEKGDVGCAFKYLRNLGTVSSIGIWGRSMGAVTALMYADQNHQIGCIVCDSPFSNLEKLSKELAQKHGGGLSIFSGIALKFIRSTIKDKNDFDIQDLDPIGKHVTKAYIPAFFIHGEQDDFIIPKHSIDLHKAYGGDDKRIKIVPGDHNDERPQELLQEVATFFYYGLCVGDLVKEDKQFMQQQKKSLKGEKKEIPQYGYNFSGAGVEQDMEEELIKQAIALSLAESKPKKEQQDLIEFDEDEGEKKQ